MSQTNPEQGQTLADLRRVLFDTINGVKSGTLDITKASVINDLSRTLVDTAKVEVDFLRVTGSDQSAFIAPAGPALPPPTEPEHNNGIVSITRHAIGR